MTAPEEAGTETAPASLAAALVRVQAALPHVHKGQEATVTSDRGTYTYRYADLPDVANALHPLLAEHGLAFLARPTYDDAGRFVLRYSLLHAPSGEREDGDYPLPNPSSTKPQAVGSAITYARRYSLCCVTGLVPDEDDDGQTAQDAPAAAPQHTAQDYLDALRRQGTTVVRVNGLLADAREAGLLEAEVTLSDGQRITLQEAGDRRLRWLAEQEARRVEQERQRREQQPSEGNSGEQPPDDA